ncbi:MAG: DnaJ C-terminal domain-containing protein [Beijerinckiaceae bacterium]
MRNPYDVLGVPKGASEAEIKKAFRRAAKQHHPDQNTGDPRASERFSEANSAYEILGDGAKRAQFDRGEIGPDGKPRYEGFGGGVGGGRGAGNPSPEDIFRQFRDVGGMGGGPSGSTGGFDPNDIFGRMFNETAQKARNPGQQRRAAPPKGADATATLTLTLEEIAEGTPRRVKLPTGRDLEVAIPRNIADGQTVRLRGQGYSSPTGGEPGDTMLTIRIAPHARFRAEGKDLHTRFAVALADAVLGGPVRVPTLDGGVEITLQPMTSGGRTFRLRGKGLPSSGNPGDLYATVEIVLPEGDDPELTALMRRRKGG